MKRRLNKMVNNSFSIYHQSEKPPLTSNQYEHKKKPMTYDVGTDLEISAHPGDKKS